MPNRVSSSTLSVRSVRHPPPDTPTPPAEPALFGAERLHQLDPVHYDEDERRRRQRQREAMEMRRRYGTLAGSAYATKPPKKTEKPPARREELSRVGETLRSSYGTFRGLFGGGAK